jgi:hypothetical protein
MVPVEGECTVLVVSEVEAADAVLGEVIVGWEDLSPKTLESSQ